ncbi:MAG: 4-hydroxythreonine-4-phosphate dehydrogenase PdxA [Gammaproteobacteria bacterium]|nr:4-hydroxythreonine-4-phosphate dehydrogenase PdxA [Gammaproteobacteria bacterium]MCH9743831.1 4-hydroxythreonine-4-phosphate dehydrogenase PdxA [Gammaproteobacteria bacterium]
MSKTFLNKPIAITPGEPAGIGPDIILSLLEHNRIQTPIVIIADQKLLQQRAQMLNYKKALQNQFCQIQHVACHDTVTPGQPHMNNAQYVLDTIKIAAIGCMQEEFHAMVTGPVHKSMINQSGIPFRGHTEFLATLSHTDQTVMMLMSNALKIALLTTHIPLKQVSNAITQDSIIQAVRIIQHDLQHHFEIERPRINICGLNPHCGEQGQLSDEEQEIIIPAMQCLQSEGIQCMGPVSADSAFTPHQLDQCDITLTMYHDQGLPVIKALDFHAAINVTLGLPLIRTSVDHGTALDLAGSGKANDTSLLNAIQLAQQLTPLTEKHHV